MGEIRLIIADDHQIIIDGLKSIFEQEVNIEIAGEANNGREVLNLLTLIPADIVLLDLDMPVLNGIETSRFIKKDYPETKVIILSMHFEKSLIKKLIEIGIDGYILKNSDKTELLAAVNKVTAGGKYFSSDITIALADKQGTLSSAIQASSHKYDLTKREIEILKFIAEGFTNKEIGDKLHISHRTVDTHRTNLMKKIEVGNIAGLIRFAIQNGYVN